MSENKTDYHPADHLLDLKGKAYLPVAARIVWLRQDHPDAHISTTLVEWDKAEGFAMYRAAVTLPTGGHAEATATQTKRQFGDYLEKAETKAIGRALGFLGYGTLAAFEDEPHNPIVADAPAARPRPTPADTGGPVGWTDVWLAAKKRGIQGREELGRALGVANPAALDPGDLLTLINDLPAVVAAVRFGPGGE